MANQHGPHDPRWQPQQHYGHPPHPPAGYPQQYQQPYGQPYPPPGPGYGAPPPGKGPVFWLLAVCAPILLLAGCMAVVISAGSDTTVTTQPDRPGAAQRDQGGDAQPTLTEDSQETQPAPVQEPEPTAAAVGGTITLKGIKPELQVAVTLEKIVDNATPQNDFLKPRDGNRFYAVELTLANTGQAVYSDSPSNGAFLIDSEGQQYQTTFGDVQEGVVFSGSVTMSAGDKRKGLLIFEVPKSTKISKLQFALNSGFADQKGEWLTQ
ncbi:hypothetical protein GCM10010517_43740 [Streptosporangium fragile]|uniref:DUF4352 domain-containing protein n=1 Tax=Streptosporangium fragile TaxID=46186 RepID=A0ABP6IGE6_9ACTN